MTAQGGFTPTDLCSLLDREFTTEQLDAITAPLEPGVIIAGAGTGKTTVMAARVVWLVARADVAAHEVLGLTFTRKAAGELADRIRHALMRAGFLGSGSALDVGEPLVMTYDAFAGRIVADHGIRAGIDAPMRLVAGPSRYQWAHEVVTADTGAIDSLARLTSGSIVERILTLDSDMQSHVVSEAELVEHGRAFVANLAGAPLNRRGDPYASLRAAEQVATERLELARLVSAYQSEKARHGAVEFADQMALAVRLAQGVPDVGEHLRRQFRVVLLDEYQDTSVAQARLLSALFSGPDEEQGRGHPVTAVGDPYQAIYGWRGASANNLRSFSAEFPRRDGRSAESYALTINRRSGTQILQAANVLAARLTAREHADVVHSAQQSLASTAAESSAPASTIHRLLQAPPGTPAGELRSGSFGTWAEEVAFVADDIANAGESGLVSAWSDVAVLSRRNDDLHDLYAALTARDIPVEIVGLGGLLDAPEVSDVVAYLQLMEDPGNNPALVRVLTGPRWRIGPADLAYLGRRAAASVNHAVEVGQSMDERLLRVLGDVHEPGTPRLWAAMADANGEPFTSAASARFAAFRREFQAMVAGAPRTLPDLIRHIASATGLAAELACRPDAGAGSQLDAFIAIAAEFSSLHRQPTVAGFLSYLEAERRFGNGFDRVLPAQADAVKLLTVHKAKGLEWDRVYLPALVSDVFPNVRVTNNWLKQAASIPSDLRGDAASVPQLREVSDRGAHALAEDLALEARLAEDRLVYVAATRARRTLTVTTHQWAPGITQPRTPSPYFDVIAPLSAALAEVHEPNVTNPMDGIAEAAWPVALDGTDHLRRQELADQVTAAIDALSAGVPRSAEDLTADEQRLVSTWDADFALLLAEAQRQAAPASAQPTHVSVTGLARALGGDSQWFTDVQRRMPRPPRPEARVGDRMHAWLEGRYQAQTLFSAPHIADRDAADFGPDEGEFLALQEAFEGGEFADRSAVAVEVPFSLVLGDLVVRGRIDAVFRQDDGRFLVVDWKSGESRAHDPRQLALYRLAWSELQGIPLDQVEAGFYNIRSAQFTPHSDLPDRAQLVRAMTTLGREG